MGLLIESDKNFAVCLGYTDVNIRFICQLRVIEPREKLLRIFLSILLTISPSNQEHKS